MNWSEIQNPNNSISHYTHIICKTPLGTIMIEWKSWKTDESDFSITIENMYIGSETTLEFAKESAKKYLQNKLIDLKNFLES